MKSKQKKLIEEKKKKLYRNEEKLLSLVLLLLSSHSGFDPVVVLSDIGVHSCDRCQILMRFCKFKSENNELCTLSPQCNSQKLKKESICLSDIGVHCTVTPCNKCQI